MKKKNKNLVAFIMTALIAAYCTGLTALALSPADFGPTLLGDVNGSNPLESLATWIENWAGYVKVLVPAIGTVAIIVIGIVTMTAGSQWSGKAKTLMVSVIVGIAIVAYGPSIISAMFGSN